MNLLEFENERFGDLWNDKTIKELKEQKSLKRIYGELFPDVDRLDEHWEIKQDGYHCWRGWRLPQWIK